MKLGNDGHEHSKNMKKVLTLTDGTQITMTDISALIIKNGEDNIPYLNSFAKDAFFANDMRAMTQLYEAIKD